ncbi:MAG TPA: carbohydrate-binding domain-containing protein [Planctomycetota bacterium]|nr:carbohydrate-binding domain-containing protein [Planctomycetota bacterium]
MHFKNTGTHRGVRWGIFSAVASIVFAMTMEAHAATSPADYAVQVSASVSTSPAKITLSWPSFGASSYKIYRKSFGSTSWGSVIASLSGSATSWTDTNVSVGGAYEYQVVRSANVTGYGYIYAGVNANMIDGRGRVALVVDSSMSGPLSSELDRLEMDLIGDGWTVSRINVGRSDSVSSVKNAIKSVNPRSVFLFGRVPVPYSGNLAPDGHADHVGAWPADVYYGEWGGSWSDSSVNNTAAKRNQNDNVPGDGKFDQSNLPSDVDAEVGRVDLYDMGQFGKSETELLRQYLNKNNAFRHGRWSNARRGVVDDNFGDYQGQAFASNGWRNFAPMFGAGNVTGGDFFSGSYLWGYGTGGGNYTSAAGVGSTSSFSSGTSVVFTMLFGSYFGDWDSTNNFLRAPLCAPSGGLSASWSARPYWFYHHMGLGETIGYGAKISQNNSGHYYTISHSVRGVHMALMGDPTLRLHAVKPPSGLTATAGGGVTLRWTASPDSNIVGYHVYRSSSQKGSYTRLTSSPVGGTSYTDSSVSSGTFWYMVRAVKLESCGSGSYYNPSQGVFASSGASGGGGGSAPSAPSGLSASGGDRQISLSWTGSSGATSYKIKRSGSSGGSFTQVGTTSGTSYTDTGLTNGTPCYYVVSAVNGYGESGNSNQASATPTAPVTGGSLPSPWQTRDVGSVGVAGSASHSSGTFTLKGSGADIWDTADGFRFVYQPLNGDGTIVARVASLQNTDPWAKAGVMIRDGLNANGAHAMMAITALNGAAFQRRLSTGATTEHTGTSGGNWVKLIRTGSTIAGYISNDNATWTKVNSCTLTLGSSVYVGLVVTSHNNGVLCTAALDSVSVTTGTSGGGGSTGGGGGGAGTGGAIPGKIQAEDYNTGGEGVAYHDVSSKNEGGAYRAEAVDIGATSDVGGGYYVGWTAAGEWLMYNISASASDSYTFTLRTATTKSGMTVHLEVDGVKVGTGTVPNTGGWESWAYTTISGVNVSAGAHKLKLVFDTGNISVNYITVSSAAAARTATTLASVTANPTPAKALEPVGFNAATAQGNYGTDEDPIAIVWDFGDGTYDVGNTPAHTYTAGGDYDVRVTVSDSAGNAQGQNLRLPVAATLEGNAGALTIKRLVAGVHFNAENRDMLRLEAAVEIPADVDLKAAAVSVDVGGAVIQGNLDAKGKAKLGGGLVKVTRIRGSSQALVSVMVQRTSLAAALENEGIRNADIQKAPVAVPVIVRIGDHAFAGTFDGSYSARSGRTGRVK